jgi:putative ABC transport system permease protein
MRALWSQLRLAGRSWLGAPLVAATAIGTLALGVGVTTAVFSVASGAILNVVPWSVDANRLVSLQAVRPRQTTEESQDTTRGAFLDWQAQAQSFEGLTAWEFSLTNLTDGDDGGIVVEGQLVSPGSLTLFGVGLELGRPFGPQDVEPGAAPVAILSHGLWERRYGADPALVGRTIEIDDSPVTVVGVLREDQYFPGPATQLVRPLRIAASESSSRTERTLFVVALLKPGVSIAQARGEMEVISRRLEQQYPETDAGWTVSVRRIAEVFAGERVRRSVVVLGAAIVFVLLIVCANIANLLLARSAARGKEIATRSAVGASRAQLVAQLLLENAWIAALALPIGLLIGRGMVELFLSMIPATINWMDQVFRFDVPVLLFALAATAATVLVFGLVPALQSSRVDLQRALKEGGGRGATAARPWVRQALAVAQLGLAIALLSTAALIIDSVNRMQARDPGIDVDQLLVTSVQLPASRYPTPAHWRRFQADLLHSLESVPGVEASGSVNFPPFGFPGGRVSFSVEGQALQAEDEVPSALYSNVSQDYFRALGLDIVRGRGIGADDREGGVPVVVINATLARRHFGDQDPLGRRLTISGSSREVVGVVSDFYNLGLRDSPVPHLFVPFEQDPWSTLGIVVRSRSSPAALAPAVRTALRQLDTALPFPGFFTMAQRVENQIWTARFMERLMLILGCVAMLLAALGVYAVISYSTAQRAHEFAIRAALGAEPRGMAALVLSQASWLALGGTLLAFGLTWSLRPLLAGLLYEQKSWDPLVFVGIALALSAVALLAAAHPALRATQSDPMDALRAE